MPAYVFSHVVLITALLVMFTLVSFYFLVVFQASMTNLERRALETVSTEVASKLIHLTYLSNLTTNEVFMYKVVQVPPDINERTYNVTLVNHSNRWFVVVHHVLVSSGKPMLNGSSNITEAIIRSSATVQLEPISLPLETITVNASVNSNYLFTEHNGHRYQFVVWCWKKREANNYKLYVGFGLMDGDG